MTNFGKGKHYSLQKEAVYSFITSFIYSNLMDYDLHTTFTCHKRKVSKFIGRHYVRKFLWASHFHQEIKKKYTSGSSWRSSICGHLSSLNQFHIQCMRQNKGNLTLVHWQIDRILWFIDLHFATIRCINQIQMLKLFCRYFLL